MDLDKFKRKIKLELENRVSGRGKTPILDRFELHLGDLKGDYTLDTLLDEDNMKHELWVSMLYKLVHPKRKSLKRKKVDDDFILEWVKEGKTIEQLRAEGYSCSYSRFAELKIKYYYDNSRV